VFTDLSMRQRANNQRTGLPCNLAVSGQKYMSMCVGQALRRMLGGFLVAAALLVPLKVGLFTCQFYALVVMHLHPATGPLCMQSNRDIRMYISTT